jgi:uncharacterized membrane protein YfcA
MLRIILTILVGTLSGIFGGAFGLGGSFIMLPGLILFNIIPDYKTAVGTVLLSLLPPVSILAVMDYYKRKKVDTMIGVILFLTYFIAAKYGARINKNYSNRFLKYASALIFFLVGSFFLWSGYNDKE